MVRGMNQEREEMHRPLLTLQLVPWTGNLVKLRIQNVGGGPAFNVHGEIHSETKDGIITIPWSYEVLGVDKYEEFGVPTSKEKHEFEFNLIREAGVRRVRANLKCKSAANVEYITERVINVEELTGDWVASHMLVTEDNPDRLMPRIARAIENLKK